MTTNKTSKKTDSAANAGKMQRGKPFKKGESGNPAGKKPGTRHRATIIAEQLIDAEAEELVRVCLDKAKAGDSTCMKLVMDRLVSVRKDRPIQIDLPEIKTTADIVSATGLIADAVAHGGLTPLEAQLLAGVVEAHRKSLEVLGHEERLLKLEQQAEAKK